ncbi:MAG: lysophospholipid acyltransferase family protein [Thermodesulfobacteriota bacterium]|nr:lysophospholipid acyltransferase family protein [Thermodesulfobacteriota bacterium]
MNLLRSIYFWVVITFSCLVALPVIILVVPFDKRGKIIGFCAAKWGRLNLFTSGVKLEISGLENIIRDKPQIFMSNHQSIYDIIALTTLPLHLRWLAKKELFQVPVLGWLMLLVGCVSIDRLNPHSTVQSINSARAKLQRGDSVMIFPEGTRSYDGMLQPFMKGGFILALRTKIPIVPITIIDTYKIMQRGTRIVHPGNIKVIIDKPIETFNMGLKDRSDLMDKVRGVITKNLLENCSD